MKKQLFTELEAVVMASHLSHNLYYADDFSPASFAVFCKNLPKPVSASVQSTRFDRVTHRSVTLVLPDFFQLCLLFDTQLESDSDMFHWLTNLMFSDWSLCLDHYYSYRCFKS